MKKAAIYAKCECENQQKDGVSFIEWQIDKCLEYCMEYEYEVSTEHIFTDITDGSLFFRKAYTNLWEAAKKHKFEVVVVYDLTRFATDELSQLLVLFALEMCGAEVEYLSKEGFKVTDPTLLVFRKAGGMNKGERTIENLALGLKQEYDRLLAESDGRISKIKREDINRRMGSLLALLEKTRI